MGTPNDFIEALPDALVIVIQDRLEGIILTEGILDFCPVYVPDGFEPPKYNDEYTQGSNFRKVCVVEILGVWKELLPCTTPCGFEPHRPMIWRSIIMFPHYCKSIVMDIQFFYICPRYATFK